MCRVMIVTKYNYFYCTCGYNWTMCSLLSSNLYIVESVLALLSVSSRLELANSCVGGGLCDGSGARGPCMLAAPFAVYRRSICVYVYACGAGV